MKQEHRLKEVIYSTPRFDVIREYTLIDGIVKDFHYVSKNDSTSIVAFSETKIALISQYRTVTAEISLELPGGRVEDGESPLDAAKRELFEETGLIANDWQHLTSVFPLPSVTNEKVHVYAAKVEEKQIRNSDEEECITSLGFFAIDKLNDLVMKDRFNCSLDAYAILYFLNWLKTTK